MTKKIYDEMMDGVCSAQEDIEVKKEYIESLEKNISEALGYLDLALKAVGYYETVEAIKQAKKTLKDTQ